MNILFLSLSEVWDLNERGIYTDLLREFMKRGDKIHVVTPLERRYKQKTELIRQGDARILKVRTLNIQKTGILEKGLGTIALENQFLRAIKKYYRGISFDLILYATPPITLVKPIRYLKKRDHAATYLLLKDIFPQNAVDLGMMKPTGLKGILYRIFRKKEKLLYAISNHIGCMSQANVDYVLKHNPGIRADKVGICPNCIEVQDLRLDGSAKTALRKKYGIPLDKKVFVYGGNLGKPQGIPFIIECLKTQELNPDAFFLIVGDGTEVGKLRDYINQAKPCNVKLLKRLPQEDYDRMIAACDIGMIFLDHRFTIPNFPSRLLSYMQAGLPVLACTDPNTDIGKVITEGGFGWWCESNKSEGFISIIKQCVSEDLISMGKRGKEYLDEHYSVNVAYRIITEQSLFLNN